MDTPIPPPPGSHQAAAWTLALRDVIDVPGAGPASVTSIEQAAGECAPVLVGYQAAGNVTGRVEFGFEQQVTILRDSPARVA